MRENEKNTAIYIAYEEAVPFDPAVPEKNLLRAVLLSAMLDLKKSGDAGRRAIEYFLSPDQDYLFSFSSICNFLNVDTDKILSVTGLKHDMSVVPVAAVSEVSEEDEESAGDDFVVRSGTDLS